MRHAALPRWKESAVDTTRRVRTLRDAVGVPMRIDSPSLVLLAKKISTIIVCLGIMSNCVNAQWVQLPTFHSFSVNTSVLVPDRGAVMLGGVNRSFHSRGRAGRPGMRLGPGALLAPASSFRTASASSSTVSVNATIIDLQAMDAALLNEARASHATRPKVSIEGRTRHRNTAIGRRAAWIKRHLYRP